MMSYELYTGDFKNNKDTFIHFKNQKMCNFFMSICKNKYVFGNICCKGKGVEVKNITWDTISDVKKQFKEDCAKIIQRTWKQNYLPRKRAAITIQQAWLKCRWDPKYKMCAIVQWRNHNEIS